MLLCNLFFRLRDFGLSTQVDMHFVSSLARVGLGHHMMSYILCARWHAMSLVNTCCDTFCGLRYILCPSWYGRDLRTVLDCDGMSLIKMC
jgi:hypothetical protein